MKNTFFMFCAAILLGFSAQAQTKKVKKAPGIKVPEVVNVSFTEGYVDATENTWSKNYTGYYVAKFTNAASQKQEVEFNTEGSVVKSKVFLDVNALPENVRNALQAKYAEAKVNEVVWVQIPGVAPYYKASLELNDRKKELLISEDGIVANY